MSTIYNGNEFDRFASGRFITIDGIPLEAIKLLAIMTWDYKAKASAARLLIDTMGVITEKYPQVRLIIAAKIEHRRYAQENEEYLAARPWRGSIKILYNQTNVPDLLASCDLFLYAPPNSIDSLRRALLEAHSAGLPIVATVTAGCPEIVQNSITGVLGPYDAKPLAEHVIDLLDDPRKRQEMGRRGRERV